MSRTGGEIVNVPKSKGRISLELQSAGGEKGAEGAYTPTGEPLNPKVVGDIDLLKTHPDAAGQVHAQLQAATVDELSRLARGKTTHEGIQRFGASDEALENIYGAYLGGDIPLGSGAITRLDKKGVETVIHPSQSLERKPTVTIEESLEGNLPQRIDQRLQEFQEPGGYVERVNPNFTLMGKDAIIGRANQPTDYDLLRGILKQDYYDLPPGQRFHPEDDPSKFLSAKQIRRLSGEPRKTSSGKIIYPEGSLHKALFGQKGSNLRKHASLLNKLKEYHGESAWKDSPVTDVIRTGNVDELFDKIQSSRIYQDEGKFFDHGIRFPAQIIEGLKSGKLGKASPEVQNYLMRWILNKAAGTDDVRFGIPGKAKKFSNIIDPAAEKAKREILERVERTKAIEDVTPPKQTNPNRIQEIYDEQMSLSPRSMRNLPTEAEEARKASLVLDDDTEGVFVPTQEELVRGGKAQKHAEARKGQEDLDIDRAPNQAVIKEVQDIVNRVTNDPDEQVSVVQQLMFTMEEMQPIDKRLFGNEGIATFLSKYKEFIVDSLRKSIEKKQSLPDKTIDTGPEPLNISEWEKITDDLNKLAIDEGGEKGIVGVSQMKPLMDEWRSSPSEKLRRHMTEPAVPGHGEKPMPLRPVDRIAIWKDQNEVFPYGIVERKPQETYKSKIQTWTTPFDEAIQTYKHNPDIERLMDAIIAADAKRQK